MIHQVQWYISSRYLSEMFLRSKMVNWGTKSSFTTHRWYISSVWSRAVPWHIKSACSTRNCLTQKEHENRWVLQLLSPNSTCFIQNRKKPWWEVELCTYFPTLLWMWETNATSCSEWMSYTTSAAGWTFNHEMHHLTNTPLLSVSLL